jgi:HEPN domain-containing protein
MTNKSEAEEFIRTANEYLAEAERHFQKENYNIVVGRSQEVVEVGIKGIFRLIGIEYPKVHDVGEMFYEEVHRRFPEEDTKTLGGSGLYQKA